MTRRSKSIRARKRFGLAAVPTELSKARIFQLMRMATSTPEKEFEPALLSHVKARDE
jgi:hypothetical protein